MKNFSWKLALIIGAIVLSVVLLFVFAFFLFTKKSHRFFASREEGMFFLSPYTAR